MGAFLQLKSLVILGVSKALDILESVFERGRWRWKRRLRDESGTAVGAQTSGVGISMDNNRRQWLREAWFLFGSSPFFFEMLGFQSLPLLLSLSGHLFLLESNLVLLGSLLQLLLLLLLLFRFLLCQPVLHFGIDKSLQLGLVYLWLNFLLFFLCSGLLLSNLLLFSHLFNLSLSLLFFLLLGFLLGKLFLSLASFLLHRVCRLLDKFALGLGSIFLKLACQCLRL